VGPADHPKAVSRVTSYAGQFASRDVSLKSLGVGLAELTLWSGSRPGPDRSAIDLLAAASVPVLGWRVYLAGQGRIEVGYANWYTDPHDGEPRDRSARRRLDRSREYVSRLWMPPDGQALFVLVAGGG